MADTATSESLSGTRALRFTVAGVTKMAWKLARAGSIRESPDAEDYEFMRQALKLKMDEISAHAPIARQVVRHSITMVATTASYALDGSIFDVDGRATFTSDSTYDRLVWPMGRDQYMNLVYKNSPGPPSRYYPEKTSVVTIYPWPVPDAAGTLVVQAERYLQDVATTSQTMDLERYWQPWIVHTIAEFVARTLGIDSNHCDALERKAARFFDLALGRAKQRGNAQFVMSHKTGWVR